MRRMGSIRESLVGGREKEHKSLQGRHYPQEDGNAWRKMLESLTAPDDA